MDVISTREVPAGERVGFWRDVTVKLWGPYDLRCEPGPLPELEPAARTASMTLEGINPEGLPLPPTYTHVIVATGSKLVFIAGQEPEDAQGDLVGAGDLAAQARQVFANLGRALAAAGARPEQVTKLTIFVVGHRVEYLPVIEAARTALFGNHKPADTLVGVATLARPEYLIEVDAMAVI